MQDQVHTDELNSLPLHTEPLDTSSTIESTIADSVVTATEPPEEPLISDNPTMPLMPAKRYFRLNWWSIVACLLLLILVGEHVPSLVISLTNSLLHPTATVTLFPTQKTMSQTYSFLAVTGTVDQAQKQIPSRILSFTTPSKTETIKTTGVGYTPAIQATGGITFYNEATYEQTIGAGTVLTGSDGVQVVTDETAYVKPGNPPYLGSATVSAHAIQGGTLGNIALADINTPCCLSGISAKNMESFRGGEDPKTYPIVSQADVDAATKQLTGMLDPLAKEAIGKQMKATEQLLIPFNCTSQTTSTPKVGEKATQAQVNVSETCTSQVYDDAALQELTRSQFLRDVATQAGADFIPKGTVAIALGKATLLDKSHNAYQLSVSVTGSVIFHLSKARLSTLTRQIAGKRIDQAQRALLQLQGVQGVYIRPVSSRDNSLPTDPGQIAILVMTSS